MAGLFSRRNFVILASIAIVGLMGYAGMSRFRAGGAGGAIGTSGSEAVPIAVQTSQLFVSLENQSGLSLFDVRVGIVPVGRATVFTSSIGRMDPGEKRDIPVANFRGREGTPFNLRIHRPRTVEVTATDINQKQYKSETDWK